eukprot:COSAG05_NODE_18784_length_303_cov_0.666667_1_plen_37_part_01
MRGAGIPGSLRVLLPPQALRLLPLLLLLAEARRARPV